MEPIDLLCGNEEKDSEMLRFLYSSALRKMNTRISILEQEFITIHHYDPIEHVTSRLKTKESIRRKLLRDKHETDHVSMLRYLNDIAGLRIVCSFNSDIYKIADMISAQDDIKVLIIKNYIASPKSNGYKSYHMIVTIPVFMADGAVDVKVEIQIRTIAMDFWASLEHKIYYKFEGDAPEYIKDELAECAKMINALDDRMLALNEAVQSIEVKKNDDKA
ncbi:MAG: GTP pyrophosphokinase family protein [Lachnospiraceae bacterium]|nr:GTP pyrophosphokinase family protein [Lachnospiraceae bacterium]MBQ7601144.1 GTP pyrophosphokinase family protein [Lachnospiraceae bacterium]MBR5339547.1 GTP pyrophosphokinase family protein [Lachnospiraceae bacterium]